jgi:hypothetical protein
VELKVGDRIGTAEVDMICGITDDVYRNRWITYGYYDISRRLRTLIDHNGTGDATVAHNASWCTFSTWSSRTIGQNMRPDELTPGLAHLLEKYRFVIWPIGWLLRFLDRNRKTRNGAVVARVLALGNRLVFGEIGHAVAGFIEEFRSDATFDRKKWEKYRETIVASPPNDLFRKGRVELLKGGVECYYLAMWETDPRLKAELVLKGNLLIGVYEQRRLDPTIKAALSLFPRRLLRVEQSRLDALTGARQFANVTLRRKEQPWALRHKSWIRRRLASAYARFLTRRLMTIQLPLAGEGIQQWRLGVGLRSPVDRTSPYMPPLNDVDALQLEGLRALLARYGRLDGAPRSARAGNWSKFDDRMNYISNLFRARQPDDALYGSLGREDLEPLTPPAPSIS